MSWCEPLLTRLLGSGAFEAGTPLTIVQCCSTVMKHRVLAARLLVQIPALLFTSGVNLGKFLNLSLAGSSSVKCGLRAPTSPKQYIKCLE